MASQDEEIPLWVQIAFGISILLFFGQIYYTSFKKKGLQPLNPQPEIYERLEEIKRMRKERNSKGVFNQKDLTKYNGFDNPERYVGIKNEIFDVSSSRDFGEGGPNESLVGKEISVNLAKLDSNPEYAFQYENIELSADEIKQLDATYAAFKVNYQCVGKLQFKRTANLKKNE